MNKFVKLEVCSVILSVIVVGCGQEVVQTDSIDYTCLAAINRAEALKRDVDLETSIARQAAERIRLLGRNMNTTERLAMEQHLADVKTVCREFQAKWSRASTCEQNGQTFIANDSYSLCESAETELSGYLAQL